MVTIELMNAANNNRNAAAADAAADDATANLARWIDTILTPGAAFAPDDEQTQQQAAADAAVREAEAATEQYASAAWQQCRDMISQRATVEQSSEATDLAEQCNRMVENAGYYAARYFAADDARSAARFSRLAAAAATQASHLAAQVDAIALAVESAFTHQQPADAAAASDVKRYALPINMTHEDTPVSLPDSVVNIAQAVSATLATVPQGQDVTMRVRLNDSWSVSIVRNSFSYGGSDGLYESLPISAAGDLCHHIAARGYMTPGEVADYCVELSARSVE